MSLVFYSQSYFIVVTKAKCNCLEKIWGKLIKRKIYKKALDLVGDIIYSEKIVWCEDRIVNFFLLRVANSFKFIKKDGIIHLVTKRRMFLKKKKVLMTDLEK